MSETVCTPPIISAVKKADDIIGENRVWQATNNDQRNFLEGHYKTDSSAVPNIAEIQSIADFDAEKINQFLLERGFNIQLNPFAPGEFGVASVLDLLVEWLHKGRSVTVTDPSDKKTYPAVFLKEGSVEICESSYGPVARIATKSQDVVYMMIHNLPSNQAKSFVWHDWVSFVEAIEAQLQPNYDYEGLIFPKVDLNQNVDIDWLIGMNTVTSNGQNAKISQAKQQTKLRMNEEGARIESAVAIGIVVTSMRRSSPPLVINQPFLIWFRRPGLAHPLFVGHITQEDWKDPETLGKKTEHHKDDPKGRSDQFLEERLSPLGKKISEFPPGKGPKDRAKRLFPR